MPDKQQIAGAIAAILIAQNFRTIRRLMKERKILIQAYMAESKTNDILMQNMDYLIQTMQENDIPFDEFDFIMLANGFPTE